MGVVSFALSRPAVPHSQPQMYLSRVDVGEMQTTRLYLFILHNQDYFNFEFNSIPYGHHQHQLLEVQHYNNYKTTEAIHKYVDGCVALHVVNRLVLQTETFVSLSLFLCTNLSMSTQDMATGTQKNPQNSRFQTLTTKEY